MQIPCICKPLLVRANYVLILRWHFSAYISKLLAHFCWNIFLYLEKVAVWFELYTVFVRSRLNPEVFEITLSNKLMVLAGSEHKQLQVRRHESGFPFRALISPNFYDNAIVIPLRYIHYPFKWNLRDILASARLSESFGGKFIWSVVFLSRELDRRCEIRSSSRVSTFHIVFTFLRVT